MHPGDVTVCKWVFLDVHSPVTIYKKNSARVIWIFRYLVLPSSTFLRLVPLFSMWFSLKLYYDLLLGDIVMDPWLAG